MTQFTIALVQMTVEGGNKSGNLSHASELVQKAAAEADLVVLPEAMDLGWTHPSARTEASSIPDGDTCLLLRTLARENGITLCSGLVERDGEKVFNSAVIINRHGKVLLVHRKLNELEIGHEYYDQGDRLGVCHTELGTFGLMICADGFAKDHVISRSLGYMGAEFILSPSSWAVDEDHDNEREPYGDTWRQCYIPVAKEFGIWFVGVSNVGPITGGPWKGRKCIGCSLVIDPQGDEILQGPYGVHAETILYVDVETPRRPARGSGS